jgi:hypothetical protein
MSNSDLKKKEEVVKEKEENEIKELDEESSDNYQVYLDKA